MHHHTLSELSRLLADGEASSVELTQTYLERIEALDEGQLESLSSPKHLSGNVFFPHISLLFL